MDVPQNVHRRVLEHRLQRRGDRFVCGVDRLVRRRAGPSSCSSFGVKTAADRRLAVFPSHLHAVGPVAEVREIELEAAVVAADARATRSRARYRGSPYGASPITLNSSP